MFWKFRLSQRYNNDPKRLIEAVEGAEEEGQKQIPWPHQAYFAGGQ